MSRLLPKTLEIAILLARRLTAMTVVEKSGSEIVAASSVAPNPSALGPCAIRAHVHSNYWLLATYFIEFDFSFSMYNSISFLLAIPSICE
jgi:hypothetical protein